jgi:hypothetical protein
VIEEVGKVSYDEKAKEPNPNKVPGAFPLVSTSTVKQRFCRLFKQ